MSRSPVRTVQRGSGSLSERGEEKNHPGSWTVSRGHPVQAVDGIEKRWILGNCWAERGCSGWRVHVLITGTCLVENELWAIAALCGAMVQNRVDRIA